MNGGLKPPTTDIQQRPHYQERADFSRFNRFELKTQEYSSEQTAVLMNSTGYSASALAHTATPYD